MPEVMKREYVVYAGVEKMATFDDATQAVAYANYNNCTSIEEVIEYYSKKTVIWPHDIAD